MQSHRVGSADCPCLMARALRCGVARMLGLGRRGGFVVVHKREAGREQETVELACLHGCGDLAEGREGLDQGQNMCIDFRDAA